jgi:hypothetical protein
MVSDDDKRWRVTPLSQPELPRTLDLDAGGLGFGRDPANAVVLAAPGVSALHARLTLTPEGPVLEDLGSRNGTYVRGEGVERRALAHGDVFELGPGGPRFQVIRAAMLAETVAMPRPTLTEEMRGAAPRSIGARTLFLVRQTLGLPDGVGVEDVVRRRTRAIGIVFAVLVLVMLGTMGVVYRTVREQGEAEVEKVCERARGAPCRRIPEDRTRAYRERSARQDDEARHWCL